MDGQSIGDRMLMFVRAILLVAEHAVDAGHLALIATDPLVAFRNKVPFYVFLFRITNRFRLVANAYVRQGSCLSFPVIVG
jgi:hypothetical protein